MKRTWRTGWLRDTKRWPICKGGAWWWGAVSQVVDRLGEYAGAGVQRVMLQWLNLDDLDGLEAFAKGVLPQVH